jgi:hypothetical protein
MIKQQEKRLLLTALNTLRTKRTMADSIDVQIDLTERINNLSHCLEQLNWSEINMRQRPGPTFWRLYTRWPADAQYKPTDWGNGKQVKNLIYASIFTDSERELVDNDLNKNHGQNPGLSWEWRKCQ